MRKGEIFVPIKGFEEDYKISNFGLVMSVERKKCPCCGFQGKKRRYLKSPVLKHGYKSVALCRRGMGTGKSIGFTVHRLVAEHFVYGKKDEKDVVNHIDGNKLNNHFSNLEWVTRSENQKHAYALGLQQAKRGARPKH